MTELRDEDAKAPSRVRTLRRVLVFGLALACAAFWIWSRYLVVKSPLGGPCHWAIECLPEAPQCMRPDVDAPGVCSRPCDLPEDCAPAVRCVEVELEERDERGSYVKAGRCVPQKLLDARRASSRKAGGAAKVEAWLDVPEGESVIEGEVTIESSRGGTKTWLVKGSLVRSPEADGGKRRVVDTASMRVFAVDDPKRTFTATAIGSSGAATDVTVEKTGKTDQVAGRTCEIWELVEKRVRRTACVVPGGAFVDPGAGLVPAWSRELAVRGVFPFRVVEREGEKEVSRMEVTKLSSRPLDRALFAVPKSYKNLATK